LQPEDLFRQHFWRQSRAALQYLIFDAFNGKSIWQKMHQIMVLGTQGID
jgi:hypothetical protein